MLHALCNGREYCVTDEPVLPPDLHAGYRADHDFREGPALCVLIRMPQSEPAAGTVTPPASSPPATSPPVIDQAAGDPPPPNPAPQPTVTLHQPPADDPQDVAQAA